VQSRDVEGVQLRDGEKVLIGAVTASDAPLLADGFSRLSDRSRHSRFLMKDALTEAELTFFTHVDHYDHEALGAVSTTDGRGVGVARYVRDANDPTSAEIAVTVIDDWQRRGLGRELLTRLIDRARGVGISRLTALVAEDDEAAIGILRSVGANVVLVDCEDDACEYEITGFASSRR
jgi:GNAT superfamily N-acetyltransferase